MQITEYTLKFDKITQNYAVALVADTHGNDPAPVLDALRAAKPDLICIPGDIEGSKSDLRVAPAEALLKGCSDIAPTYFSKGNHDLHITRDTVVYCGAVLLDDEWVRCGELNIGGLTSGSLGIKHGRFMRTPDPDTVILSRFASLDGMKILLCHHPEYYARYIKELDIDLVLSGHAHGGQWRVFGRGVFAPGQGIFPKYTSGVHDGRLVISRGLSDHNGIPRIFNPHEICMLNLIKTDGAEAVFNKKQIKHLEKILHL